MLAAVLLAATALAPARTAAAGAAPDDTLRWAPPTDEAVAWRWRAETVHRLESMELDSSSFSRRFERARFEVVDRLELVARDRLLAREDLDATRLARELVRARRRTQTVFSLGLGSSEEDELETVSRLEGARLRFALDPRAGGLRARFDEDAEELCDPDLLDGLDEPLDLRPLLGGAARRPGESWPLDELDLAHLVRPGGALAFVAAEHDFEGEHDLAALGWLLGGALVAGEADAWGRAEYEGIERTGGRRLARVGLRATVRSSGSVLEDLARLVETLGSGQTWLDLGRAIDVEHELRLEGRLLWDLDLDRALALALEGASETTLEIVIDLEAWDIEDWRFTCRMEGQLELSVEAADPE